MPAIAGTIAAFGHRDASSASATRTAPAAATSMQHAKTSWSDDGCVRVHSPFWAQYGSGCSRKT